MKDTYSTNIQQHNSCSDLWEFDADILQNEDMDAAYVEISANKLAKPLATRFMSPSKTLSDINTNIILRINN